MSICFTSTPLILCTGNCHNTRAAPPTQPSPSPVTLYEVLFCGWSENQRTSLIPQTGCRYRHPGLCKWRLETGTWGAAKSALIPTPHTPPWQDPTAVFPVLPVTSAAASWVPTRLATHTSCHLPLFCRKQREDCTLPLFRASKHPPPFGKPAAEQGGWGGWPVREQRMPAGLGVHSHSENGTAGHLAQGHWAERSPAGQGRADGMRQSQHGWKWLH